MKAISLKAHLCSLTLPFIPHLLHLGPYISISVQAEITDNGLTVQFSGHSLVLTLPVWGFDIVGSSLLLDTFSSPGSVTPHYPSFPLFLVILCSLLCEFPFLSLTLREYPFRFDLWSLSIPQALIHMDLLFQSN